MIQGLSPTVLKLKVNLSKLIRFLSPKKAGNLRISYIFRENRSKSVSEIWWQPLGSFWDTNTTS